PNFNIAEKIDDFDLGARLHILLLDMLVVCVTVAGDVPQVDIAYFKDASEVRANVRCRGYRTSGKNHQDQRPYCTTRKRRPAIGRAPEAEVIDELQQSPNDQQRGPVTHDVRPKMEWVSEIACQEQAADGDESQPPKDRSCAPTNAHWPSCLFSGLFSG